MASNRPAPMWAVDASSFRFIAANEDAGRLFGYSREALLLLTMYDVLAPEERQRFDVRFSAGKRCGDAGEWACRWPNGSRFRVAFRHYETIIDGNLVILAWAVKVVGHLVMIAPMLPKPDDASVSDDSRAQSCC